MARFEMKDDVLHVYADGNESNEGVFNGVKKIHIHNGVNLGRVLPDGIEVEELVLDYIYGMYPINQYLPHLRYVVWDISNRMEFPLTFLFPPHNICQNGEVEIRLQRDVVIKLHQKEQSFTLKEGYSYSTCKNLIRYYCYYTSIAMEDAVEDVLTTARRYDDAPLDWVELAGVFLEIAPETAESFLRKYLGRDVKKYFNELSDARITQAVSLGSMTKAMLRSLLGLANDAGRAEVVAVILDQMDTGKESGSRFSL